MKLILTLSALMAVSTATASSAPAPLPGEQSERKAISCAPFPDRMSAFVWRNWFVVPKERLAAAVGAKAEDLTRLAAEMGLPEHPRILPEWRRKGYITVLRRNWHLIDYDQLLTVVDMTRDELAYYLVEDDFLLIKLGYFKPKCGPLRWDASVVDSPKSKAVRRRIAAVLKEEGAGDFTEEPRFAFVKELSASVPGGKTRDDSKTKDSPFDVRMVFSYFADYGDPLLDPEIGSYPEGLLERLSRQGVNAVYLHVVLRTLAKDPAYPEFGEGCETRLANLNKLVKRAEKYGIKVFLYMNEPRGLEERFFEAPGRMAIRGVKHRDYQGMYAMCTSVPEVRRWMADSMEKVFRAVPGLGGIFTISSDENLTNCASKWQRERCPNCAKRTNAEVIAEANSVLVEGMRRAAPDALAIIWDWGWRDEDFDDIIRLLPTENTALQTVSEWGVPVDRGGLSTNVFEYSLSVAGPGERAKRRFAAARARGMKAFAKVQAGCSWELSSFPYLPVMDIVAEHAKNLADEGVNGVMMSWSLGGYPSPNLSAFASCRRGEAAAGTLLRMAGERYGEKAAPSVAKAWKAYSDGFREFPFHRQLLYEGPQHWGPANPLYAKPTGYVATMVGIPYDDLTHWRWTFTPEGFISQFDKTAAGFDAGGAAWRKALPLMPAEARKDAARDGVLFDAAALHFRSSADQARFILARDKGDRAEMLRVVRRELETAKRHLPLVRADSRIGYECSNHYFFTPQDVREKIVGARFMLDELQAGGESGLDQAVLHGETDKPQATDYKCGETMTFTLTLQGAGKIEPGRYFIDWSRSGDDGRREKGRVPAESSSPLVIKTKIDKPGFVRIWAAVVDAKGVPYRKKFTGDPNTPEGKKALNRFEQRDKRVFFDGGAGAEVEKLASVPEPADFDAFWSRRRARLTKVPMKAEMKEIKSKWKNMRVFAVSVACAGPRPSTGYLTVPKKPGKYPIVVDFHGYGHTYPGKGYVVKPTYWGDRTISFHCSPHGYELEREKEYYEEFFRSICSGGCTFCFDKKQNEDPENSYFSGYTYRIMRAVEWLKTVPEWDGKNFRVNGGSMGGLQSIWAAGLVEGVSHCTPIVPWCCDMGGRDTLGRLVDPWYIRETPALRYYDPVNIAKRIPKTCRVEITRAGLGDYCCPPSGIAVLYNNIPGPKKINWVQGSTHGYVPSEEHQRFSLTGNGW